MKTKNLLWAALSMTAALMMTACSSSDDNDMTEAPVAPSTSKTIPYTVTVGGDDATTRATVKDDPNNRILYFASDDKLYITGEKIQGVLEIQDGIGSASNATFSGELTYSGEGSPADNLSLTATLVSKQQTVGTQVSVNAAGAVTVNYPDNAYCASVNEAVQQYSRLTGTSTYGAKAFTLTQQTAFLNFVITFNDNTYPGYELSAVVKNGGSTLCTANVTPVYDDGVKAKFVLPVASGTTLSGATVQMGDKEALSITDATLTGKVYNVKKTQAAQAATMHTVMWDETNAQGKIDINSVGTEMKVVEIDGVKLFAYGESESGNVSAQWTESESTLTFTKDNDQGFFGFQSAIDGMRITRIDIYFNDTPWNGGEGWSLERTTMTWTYDDDLKNNPVLLKSTLSGTFGHVQNITFTLERVE